MTTTTAARDIHIAASILSADFACLGDAVIEAERGGADSIHIDMMDGHYVPNITFGLDLIPALRKRTRLPLVPHLELDNPDALIDALSHRGSDVIVVQEDTCPDLGATIDRILGHGIGAGVGVNPNRPLEPLLPFLQRVELIILLAVDPGFGGQTFNPSVLSKVREVRCWRDAQHPGLRIGMDGGINEDTIGQIVQAGADYLVIGSAIFDRDDVCQAIARLRGLIRDSLEVVDAEPR